MKRFLNFIAIMSMLVCHESFSAEEGYLIFKCKNDAGDFSFQGKPCPDRSKTLLSWKAAPQTNNLPSFSIRLSQGGYYPKGSINGISTVFQVDTGANIVSIPQWVASRSGMVCGKQSFSNTANGVSVQCESMIRELNFGNFSIRNVKAMIMPNLKQPLLGMNVLALFHIEHENGVMVISYKH